MQGRTNTSLQHGRRFETLNVPVRSVGCSAKKRTPRRQRRETHPAHRFPSFFLGKWAANLEEISVTPWTVGAQLVERGSNLRKTDKTAKGRKKHRGQNVGRP